MGCRAGEGVGMGQGGEGRLARALPALYSKCKGLGDPER